MRIPCHLCPTHMSRALPTMQALFFSFTGEKQLKRQEQPYPKTMVRSSQLRFFLFSVDVSRVSELRSQAWDTSFSFEHLVMQCALLL